MPEKEFPKWMERTVQLLGPGKVERLQGSHVLVAGLGGVGSVAAESLVRAGIGEISIIDRVRKSGMRLASSMGSAGKVDASKIMIADFKKTYNCRLAYLLRKNLRKMDITGGFRVVFSSELVDKSLILPAENEQNKKSTVGTVSYIPSIFGNMLAAIVIEDLSSK